MGSLDLRREASRKKLSERKHFLSLIGFKQNKKQMAKSHQLKALKANNH